MKYFIDTEFLEGPQKKRFFGIPYGDTKPTIDLISIGIVAEDGREYYAISKDFNFDEAWDREWIRQNVLIPIYNEKVYGDSRNRFPFSKANMRRAIRKHGKSNEVIAKEVQKFCIRSIIHYEYPSTADFIVRINPPKIKLKTEYPEFYAYYADYDWVVFCWLFGSMIDLPIGFPMYCRDLKQMLDESLCNTKVIERHKALFPEISTLEDRSKNIKFHCDYPNQKNAHNALSDAEWNKRLHDFIIKLSA